MLFALAAAAVLSTAPVPTFDFAVHKGSPTWTVSGVGSLKGSEYSDFVATALEVKDKATGKLVQTIAFEKKTEIRTDEYWMETMDLDFDGWTDLLLYFSSGSGGVTYRALRFDPRAGRFRKPVEIDNPEPDEKGKFVHTGWRFGWCCSVNEDVRFTADADEPVLLRAWDRGYNSKKKFDGPIILKAEEADAKGVMRVVCKAVLDENGDEVVKMLSGDRRKCGEPDSWVR